MDASGSIVPQSDVREGTPLHPNARRCTAIARSTGERCKKNALDGLNICRTHGGAGIAAAARANLKHGMYSEYIVKVDGRERLGQLINEFEELENPLNLQPELAALRGLFVDFIERYDKWRQAILLWHDTWDDETGAAPKPRKIMDVTEAHKLLSEISKVVERIEKIRAANAISRADLSRLMQEMGRVVERYVDSETQEKIRDAWLAIRL